MKKSILFTMFFAFATINFLTSCTANNPYENTNGTSSNGNNESSSSGSTTGSSESHNMGRDCITCHYQGGPGEEVWTVAGTVYKPDQITTYPNTTVKLYTGPNATGVLKYTLAVDAKGNFYTSRAIDYTGGLYPAVSSTTSTSYMNSSVGVGSCNSCHNGVIKSRITVN